MVYFIVILIAVIVFLLGVIHMKEKMIDRIESKLKDMGIKVRWIKDEKIEKR